MRRRAVESAKKTQRGSPAAAPPPALPSHKRRRWHLEAALPGVSPQGLSRSFPARSCRGAPYQMAAAVAAFARAGTLPSGRRAEGRARPGGLWLVGVSEESVRRSVKFCPALVCSLLRNLCLDSF